MTTEKVCLYTIPTIGMYGQRHHNGSERMTTVIMLIIFIGLLKCLDAVMTTAFEVIEDSWEVEE